jgi:putative membrane protein insertion efficiency factor
MRRRGKVVLWGLLGLTVYLTGESFLPAPSQPSARVGIALLHAYQATGSKVMASSGVQCRYTPTCSHYAEDAIAYYGTVGGLARTAGRLWRCSPWGGSGYDPAVEEHSAAYLAPQQDETPEQRKQREEAQKKMQEDLRKAAQEWDKMAKDMPKDLGKAGGACVGGCLGSLIMLGVHFAVMIVCMIFVWKDAKARGDSNAVIWLILTFFLTWIGAIVYFVARPKGDLTPCPQCKQKRLPTLPKCPHCGADMAAGAPPPAAPAKPA